MNASILRILQNGAVIPAHPLALTAQRRLDERRQRALTRYYAAAGAGGMAVGVHTTQFAIHDERVGLYEPVLALAAEEMDRADAGRSSRLVRVAGIIGNTANAVAEAGVAHDLGYHLGLLGLGALADATENELIEHCRQVAAVTPVFGFYLQSGVGGRVLPYSFWRRFVEIENVAAVKVAAFNRYQTFDVVRAVAESGRDDIALYTGNDDNIVVDLLSPYRINVGQTVIERRFVGGLLGHWAFWTQRAVQLHKKCRQLASAGKSVDADTLATAVAVTDANAAVFDAANRFDGCIPGILEVLRRQRLLEGVWRLDETQSLSRGQAVEIDRICRDYPHLADDEFIAEHRDEWLRG